MPDTNPVIAAVAERLYRFARKRERSMIPIINSPRTAAAAARGADLDNFDTLSDKQKAGWYMQAEQLVQPMLEAAAAAYARSGTIIDTDALDAETREVAGKVAEVFRQWRTEWRTSTDNDRDFPIAAVSAGLAAFAALRAAFGWEPTPTAPDVVDSMADYEKQTPAGDLVRLHLAAAHGHPVAFGAGDGEADHVHAEMHKRDQGLYGHDVDYLEWSDVEIQQAITHAESHHGQPRTQFDRPYQEHVDRSPHTAGFDDLRLHLISAHCVVNAAEMHDHEALDAHEHEHDGPGTIRNHPYVDLSWNVDRIHQMLDDMRDDRDLHRQYLEATDKVMARLKGQTK